MPRVDEDIERCVGFIARQPWGNPTRRRIDIGRGIERSLTRPESNPVAVWRPQTGLKLRRSNAAQFAIVYAYIPPNGRFPRGVVSIRAVRHARVEDVFLGVKEPKVNYGPLLPTKNL